MNDASHLISSSVDDPSSDVDSISSSDINQKIKRITCIILPIVFPVGAILGVIFSSAFPSIWFSFSSFAILPKMKAYMAFYKIITVALPIILGSSLIPLALTVSLIVLTSMARCEKENDFKKTKVEKYKRSEIVHKHLALATLASAISTIAIILINTLTFTISSYQNFPMNLKKCLITILVANGLVALTSGASFEILALIIMFLFKKQASIKKIDQA